MKMMDHSPYSQNVQLYHQFLPFETQNKSMLLNAGQNRNDFYHHNIKL